MAFGVFVAVLAVAVLDAEVFRLRLHSFEMELGQTSDFFVDFRLGAFITLWNVDLASKARVGGGVSFDSFGLVEFRITDSADGHEDLSFW